MKSMTDVVVAEVAETFDVKGGRNSLRVPLRNLFRDSSLNQMQAPTDNDGGSPMQPETEPTDAPSRFRRITTWASVVVVLAVLLIAVPISRDRMNTLQSRSQRIMSGMPRDQVEELLGAPYLTLQSTDGSHELLVWTDMFWQVDIRIDPDGHVLQCQCIPANSAYRRTQAKLSPLFQ